MVTIVFLALYVLLSAGGGSTLRVEAEKLTISTVKFDKFQEFIFENGIVTPIRTIYLDAEEGGRVEEIFVEEGSFVHKGEQPNSNDGAPKLCRRETCRRDQPRCLAQEEGFSKLLF